MTSLFTPEELGEKPKPKSPPCRGPKEFFVRWRDLFADFGVSMGLDDEKVFFTSEDDSVFIFDLHTLADKVNS